jgi:small subunit ribosomal protein S12
LRPQLKGSVTRATILTPRKPNSARRSIAKVILSTDKKITSYIPGVGHNLRRYSTVLIRGGGARDLPGVSYSCIRGVYDFMGLKHKTKRRSIYGAK